MEFQTRIKEGFTVIGKLGSTDQEEAFVQRLWEAANSQFEEVAPLAKKNPDGSLAGIWGLMSDKSGSFRPWENGFSEGLYLAGVETEDDAQPPEGWTKWTSPAYEYRVTELKGPETFSQAVRALKELGLALAGAAYDYNCPATGVGWLYFPVRRL